MSFPERLLDFRQVPVVPFSFPNGVQRPRIISISMNFAPARLEAGYVTASSAVTESKAFISMLISGVKRTCSILRRILSLPLFSLALVNRRIFFFFTLTIFPLREKLSSLYYTERNDTETF